MVLLSVLTFAGVWAAVQPRRLLRLVLALHARTVVLLDFAERNMLTGWKGFRLPARSPRTAPGATVPWLGGRGRPWQA